MFEDERRSFVASVAIVTGAAIAWAASATAAATPAPDPPVAITVDTASSTPSTEVANDDTIDWRTCVASVRFTLPTIVTPAAFPPWTASENPSGMTSAAEAEPSFTLARASASLAAATTVMPLGPRFAMGPSTRARAIGPPSRSTTA